MMNVVKYAVFALMLISSVAFADPSAPDGPVWSPPGWSCTSHAGHVTCNNVSPKQA